MLRPTDDAELIGAARTILAVGAANVASEV